ncbi:MAG: hypothetical protein A2293_02160 [Elusimicrobia bacterium RIFOXYB2_FULL_49_7]|nr:MAG: hypothetical protein A2293_02160 [Elusimicrobia bacterium RIFOXYB2_FULL_49_7]
MGDKYKRKKFFINRRLQVRYMVSLLIPMLLLILFIGLVMYYSQYKFLIATTKEMGRELKNVIITNQMYVEDVNDRNEKTVLELKERLDRYSGGDQAFSNAMLQTAYKILFLGLLVVMMELGFLTIFISHKIAGPVYRFVKFAEGIRAGDMTSRIYLRKGDELVEVAADFNQTGDFLQASFQRTFLLCDGLLNEAKKGGDASQVARLTKEFEEIRNRIRLS